VYIKLLRRRRNVYKYFFGAGKVYINTFPASPAPERYQISTYMEILLQNFIYIAYIPVDSFLSLIINLLILISLFLALVFLPF